MKAAATPDAIVIGASVGGLAAAACLARAGLSVLVLEGEGGSSSPWLHTLRALDPVLVKDLKLVRHGLKLAVRDMPLVGLRPDGRHVVLGRDPHATARALAIHSPSDAARWPRHRREVLALARALRPHWWGTGGAAALARAEDRLAMFRRAGAAAWLDAAFEAEALKATLAFDATLGGLSPLEPGSALTLLWLAAQEMCGLQGAAAVPLGGPAAFEAVMLSAAKAAGAEIRNHAPVERLLLRGHAVAGVQLGGGERIASPRVFSSLSRQQTLGRLVPDAAAGFAQTAQAARAAPRTGTAQVVLELDAPPVFGGIAVPANARFVLAERVETLVAAHAAAQAGRLPDELAFEFAVLTAADPSLAPLGRHILSAQIRPLPVSPPEGWESWKPRLAARLISALARHMPDIARHVVASDVRAPGGNSARGGSEDAISGVARILAGWDARIATPIAGLMLCGDGAEPVGALSGRAGRIAAELALKETRR